MACTTARSSSAPADTAWDMTAIGILAVELVYSILSALDAYRLAQAGRASEGPPVLRAG